MASQLSKKQCERRSRNRAKRVLSIQYRVLKAKKKGQWQLSTTEDMSVKGVSFLVEEEFRKGDKLEIQVCMSGAIEIFCGLATVVRVEKKQTGSNFFVAVELVEGNEKRSAKRYIK